MLHAAAVALDDGRVIGFVGPSGRGKTTASQALGRTYGYVTDETLAIRPDGSVVAYPKPLSIGARPGHEAHRAGLGARPSPGPTGKLRLAALVLLDRRPDVEQPYVESVPIDRGPARARPPDELPVCSSSSPLRTLVETGALDRRRAPGRLLRGGHRCPPLIDGILAARAPDQPLAHRRREVPERDCDCFADLCSSADLSALDPRVPAAPRGLLARRPTPTR